MEDIGEICWKLSFFKFLFQKCCHIFPVVLTPADIFYHSRFPRYRQVTVFVTQRNFVTQELGILGVRLKSFLVLLFSIFASVGKRRRLGRCKIYFLPISSQYLINAASPLQWKAKIRKALRSGKDKSNFGRWSKSLFYLIPKFFFWKFPLKLIQKLSNIGEHYFWQQLKPIRKTTVGNEKNYTISCQMRCFGK